MSAFMALLRKELRVYFTSPMAYLLMAVFLMVSGYFFSLTLAYTKDAGMMRYLFGSMIMVLLLVAPLLSMRLFAEEQRDYTLDLLMTSPMGDASIVLAKFLAALILLALMLLSTLHFPLILMALGEPDLPPIISGYLGVFLMGASFLALGVLTSSWSQSQMVAAALGFCLSLLLWFLNALAPLASPVLGEIIHYLSLNSHFENFSKGVLELGDIGYYLSLIALALFLSVRSIEARRWR